MGRTTVSRFLDTEIGEIRILVGMKKKQYDMRKDFDDKRLKFCIGDVRDFYSIKDACVGVDYVFHAAALKQVPSCEFYPFEAVKTNIIGTENLLNATIEQKVKKVILLSTDKAVYPINSMGISKAMMEKLMLSKTLLNQERNTIFSATRWWQCYVFQRFRNTVIRRAN